MIKLKTKIGKDIIEFETTTLKDVCKFNEIIGALPRKCDACNSDNIYLTHKNIKGNDYYLVKCKDCSAELNLHQRKEGGFFVKFGEKLEVYIKKDNQDIKSAQNKEPQDDFDAEWDKATKNNNKPTDENPGW